MGGVDGQGTSFMTYKILFGVGSVTISSGATAVDRIAASAPPQHAIASMAAANGMRRRLRCVEFITTEMSSG